MTELVTLLDGKEVGRVHAPFFMANSLIQSAS